MGNYLNPGNSGFARVLNSKYVDKTGLICVVNSTIDTGINLTCVTRPRRFGKSYAAQMLCAYYDRTVDSHGLFEKLKIAKKRGYMDHLNRYDVIYIDMTNIMGKTKPESFVSFIENAVTEELLAEYPDTRVGNGFDETLSSIVDQTGNKFIMIIDEWDAPIRELDDHAVDEYLRFLRMLFKSSSTTPKNFAAVYMTGILPIKKIKTQSALSDFEEYTMLAPGDFAEYVGFTEKEVRRLCKGAKVDFDEMKRWYDGYELKTVGPVYNPNSVMKAIRSRTFDSYWSQSSAADNLLDFISRDVAGLRQTIIALMGGVEIEIDTTGYNNDLTYTTRDAALTMLVHLGYLAYNQETRTVRIPNEEIRLEFARTIREDRHAETMKRVMESDQLIMDTVHGNEKAVAAQMKLIHEESSSTMNRNREDSLRAAIQVAYFAYKDYYVKFEELGTGEGYADIVYLPKQGKGVPILLVELKWKQDADTAIRQIKTKGYARGLNDYGSEMLLVGINYDVETKVYECKIEKWQHP
ncbi:MAG: AAA family ATPase [Clostridia bacterium]|nr:AAA family ATPase [Clostridia bacterium]